ncbi:WS/DGAT/MGAT family acyltransferase [Halopolyspora algeriensis]|uniref:WS/DGAT/MGAT family acyltransferase n=1 Tax=Halopolyspora algeriensis TaxID=1500506 RepID=A0A368W2H7_9ACTN|nr:WS/DGAT domain-containing protein [Halopolyspora algeriensis]RCW46178.1 WS/DGAT/MGAT family acyltransferase [Halopolyspora algeriensis]TQM55581.1 WS/DGAT/MGAT family acyltransferase [Halopolyspora algeriensis]
MTPPSTQSPRRVLLVSATIGEGHNATARAIEDAARRLWPECEVAWLDSLEVMGRGVGPAFRWIYVFNVESTPWLYNLFYRALWRYRWFADSSRRFVGSWSGRRLRPLIEQYQPDLIVSTYPMGTAGLDWLRRRGELDTTVAAVVSDFSPHPFWVYSEIDQHYVMSHASLRELHRAQPDAAGAVCVPPVMPAFRPADKAVSRHRMGLPEQGFLALISCGSLGFGSIERAVQAALQAPGVDCVVVTCGRNERLLHRLTQLHSSEPRLVPLDWVDDMATLTAAADVVITNAGGATALEALACGRTVVMFEPIAGHGHGNAELMAHAGLAELCPDRPGLVETLQRLTTDPQRLHDIEQRALRHTESGDFTQQVAALAELPRHRGKQTLRAQDAFFVHADTPTVPQQTGAILLVEEGRAEMSIEQWTDHLADLITRRAPHLPMLHRRLVRRRGRRAAWVTEWPDPHRHLHSRVVGTRHDVHWQEAVTEFFATAVRTDRPPWELLFLHDADDGRTALLIKLHHALGDGVAVTSTMTRLLADPDTTQRTGSPARPRTRARPRIRQRVQQRARQARTVARGLVSLAGAGPAPVSELDGPSTPERRFGWVELSMTKVHASARTHGVRTSVLLVTLLAEALHRLLDERDGTVPGQSLRAMVPRTTRSSRTRGDTEASGNRTVAVSVDLPVGPMAPEERMAEVTARLEATQCYGQPMAAGSVLTALGVLPAPVHRWVVRRMYQRRFFNVIVSALPGSRYPPRVAGALIAGVLPVLPLARGVGLGIGAITWGEMVGVGITADARLTPAPQQLADHVRAAFDDLQNLLEQDHES